MKRNKLSEAQHMITIITIPFLYLFNIGIMVMGGIVAYGMWMRESYLFALCVIGLLIILPIFIMVKNNPKKLWRAINNPHKVQKDH